MDKVFEGGDHAINSKKVDVKRAKAKPGKMFLGGLKVKLIKKSAVYSFSMIFFKCEDEARRTFTSHFST